MFYRKCKYPSLDTAESIDVLSKKWKVVKEQKNKRWYIYVIKQGVEILSLIDGTRNKDML